MPEPRLSVLIVARNEERNLEECLASTRFADEQVVIVDAASEDATLEIARRLADVVSIRTFDHFANQRNAALDLASGDWVLSIDADERVTPDLAVEIRQTLADCSHSHAGFRVPHPERSSGASLPVFGNSAGSSPPPLPARMRPVDWPGS